jgi:hypothetical protein
MILEDSSDSRLLILGMFLFEIIRSYNSNHQIQQPGLTTALHNNPKQTSTSSFPCIDELPGKPDLFILYIYLLIYKYLDLTSKS